MGGTGAEVTEAGVKSCLVFYSITNNVTKTTNNKKISGGS